MSAILIKFKKWSVNIISNIKSDLPSSSPQTTTSIIRGKKYQGLSHSGRSWGLNMTFVDFFLWDVRWTDFNVSKVKIPSFWYFLRVSPYIWPILYPPLLLTSRFLQLLHHMLFFACNLFYLVDDALPFFIIFHLDLIIVLSISYQPLINTTVLFSSAYSPGCCRCAESTLFFLIFVDFRDIFFDFG